MRTGFQTRYPGVPFFIWYTSHITYWYEDYAQTWYGAWYPTRQVVVHRFEKPSYFEVDFKYENFSTRAIFNRYGQWLETRSRIDVLPEEVDEGLRNSEFGDWIRSEHKERIETQGNEGYIYRLQVSTKNQSYIIRLNETGEIIQVKYE